MGVSFAVDSEMRDALRKPFPREQIGKLPATARRPALDYVGHAAVTDRLNTAAPDWTYTIDERFTATTRELIKGQDVDVVSCWIRGTMTVAGVSRCEFGDGADPKEALGNFLRRAAMRFGVAIDLWSKEALQTSAPATGGHRQGAEKVMEPQGADNGEAPSSVAPFAPGSETAALWDQLVAATGSPANALTALNFVPGVKPPHDMRSVGFAHEDQLQKALAKVGAA